MPMDIILMLGFNFCGSKTACTSSCIASAHSRIDLWSRAAREFQYLILQFLKKFSVGPILLRRLLRARPSMTGKRGNAILKCVCVCTVAQISQTRWSLSFWFERSIVLL